MSETLEKDGAAAPSKRPRRGVLHAALKAPTGRVASAGLIVLAVVAIAGPLVLGASAQATDFGHVLAGPTLRAPLGTDRLGQDVLYRLLVATRLSLLLALCAAGLGVALGSVIGAATLVVPRRVRPILRRAIDIMQAFPTILVGIFVSAVVGPGRASAILGVGVGVAFHFARVASALSLSIGARDHVAAARVIGVSRFRLVARHIVPGMGETLIIVFTVAIGTSIVAIAALSFLGLGVQSPDYDWGSMLQEGIDVFSVQPAMALGCGGFIAVAALCFGFAGEAFARAMNPLLWSNRTGAPGVHANNGGSGGDEVAWAAEAEPEDLPDAVVSVRKLCVTVDSPDGLVPVVSDVSLEIRPAEVVGIVGESGSGKTMTAMAIAQLLPPGAKSSGSIQVRGHELRQLRQHELDALLRAELSVVFQDPLTSLNPALRIQAQLTEAVPRETVAHRRLRDRAIAALTEASVPSPSRVVSQYPFELSGGMRQRAMIAGGLINEPKVIIADEPTTALDVTIQAQVMELLRAINRRHGTAMIVISHNLGLVAQNCTRILVMYAGRIVEEGPVVDIVADPRHPYTRALLRAIPDMSRARADRLQGIPGSAPEPGALPRGCAFQPRCPLAINRCRVEVPRLVKTSEAAAVACWVTGENT